MNVSTPLKSSLRFFVYFLGWVISAYGQIYAQPSPSQLKINVFSVSNGVGLERDRRILADALRDLGHEVQEKETYRSGFGELADINIYFEIIDPNCLASARLNWFIPNPEYYLQERYLLERMDLILCRTRHAEGIFRALNRPTYFLGFTSLDRGDKGIVKDFHSFLHLAGASVTKNTDAVAQLWRNNLSLPNLVIIRHGIYPPFEQENFKWFSYKVPENELVDFQNSRGIHLCPSIAEGFGHYIMEAMSTGAVVITTNAPPMNEFITDERCHIPYFRTSPLALSTAYFTSTDQMADVIDKLTCLPIDELKKIGECNRLAYEQKTQEFHDNLRNLLEAVNSLVDKIQ